MQAQTIVSVVRELIANGQTNAQIATVLVAMGINGNGDNGGETEAPRNGGNGEIRRNAGNPQLMPSKAYRIAAGMTAQRIAAMGLPESEQAVAVLLLQNRDGLGRRAVTERLQHATKKVTESLLFKMRTRGIIESFESDAANGEPDAATGNALAALVAAEQTQTAPANGRRGRKAKTAKRGRRAAR